MTSPKFTRRHYNAVAREIASGDHPYRSTKAAIDYWTRKFKADNPRFQPERFEAAARGKSKSPTTAAGHQKTVARKTLAMPPAMRGVMGGGPGGRGQTVKEARAVLHEGGYAKYRTWPKGRITRKKP